MGSNAVMARMAVALRLAHARHPCAEAPKRDRAYARERASPPGSPFVHRWAARGPPRRWCAVPGIRPPPAIAPPPARFERRLRGYDAGHTLAPRTRALLRALTLAPPPRAF